MLTRIVFFAFLFASTTTAQIKIGELTIPDSLAMEYFLDCNKRGEVVVNVHELPTYKNGDNTEVSGPYSEGGLLRLQLEDERLRGIASRTFKGKDGRTRYVIPRTPSARDFASFMRRRAK